MERSVILLATCVLVFLSCDASSDREGLGAAEECVEGEEITTDSGLVYVDVRCGSGDVAEGSTALTIHYVGRLADGSIFDSSRSGDEPFRFLLGAGQVIPGWDEGLNDMMVAGVREVTIPPDLAYGDTGAPPSIPPNATLTYEVELLEVHTPPD
jgi:FKBP-type peptidyl-prolyl cis-trans isomerase